MSKALPDRLGPRLLFDVFLILVALVFFFNSRDLDFRAWLFPGSFSIILLIMAIIQLSMDVKEARKSRGAAEPTAAEKSEGPSRPERRIAVEGHYARFGIATLSVLGFYLIFRFATIYLAIPVLCVLFLRFLGGRSWRITGLSALGMDAAVYIFFQLLLQTSL